MVRGVVPLGVVLAKGPRPEIAAYLLGGEGPAGGPSTALECRLRFELIGMDGIEPVVRGSRLSGPEDLKFTNPMLKPGSVVEVRLRCRRAKSGLVGRLLLQVEAGDDRFPFLVSAFAVDLSRREFRLTRRPGESPEGPGLVVYRGSGTLRTALEYAIGGSPIEWDSVRSNNPAVEEVVLERNGPEGVLRGVVHWDASRLDSDFDNLSVRFDVRVRDLPDHAYLLPVRWRHRRPLACEPAGLILPRVYEGRDETHYLQLTNVDRKAITILEVLADAPWVSGPDRGLPLEVEPGRSRTLALSIRPGAFGATDPPLTSRIDFRLEGRGRQPYTVRIEEVGRLEPLGGEVLIVPGPPRVLVGLTDEPEGRARYLSGVGDRGLSAEQLGVVERDYNEATLAKNLGTCLGRVVAGVLAAVVVREHRAVERVVVLQPPWSNPRAKKGAEPVEPGVSFVDWAELAARSADGLEPDYLVWLGASVVSLVRTPRDGVASAAVPALKGLAEPEPLGEPVNDWVGQILRPKGWAAKMVGKISKVIIPKAERDATNAWTSLAAEALLEDYRWGPELAWRRLVTAWRERLPDVHGRDVDPVEADEFLQGCLAEQVRRVARRLAAVASPGPRRPTCLFVSPLGGFARSAEVVQAVAGAEGVEARCTRVDWVERLAARSEPITRPTGPEPPTSPSRPRSATRPGPRR